MWCESCKNRNKSEICNCLNSARESNKDKIHIPTNFEAKDESFKEIIDFLIYNHNELTEEYKQLEEKNTYLESANSSLVCELKSIKCDLESIKYSLESRNYDELVEQNNELKQTIKIMAKLI